MGSGEPNIVEKSYKLLFVIYAPIALLGYLINAIGGFEINFFIMSLLSITGLSIILALIIVIRYFFIRKQIITMPDVNKNAPYLFRHDFLIPYIFISIVSFSLLSYLSYKGFVAQLTQKREVIEKIYKPKIVLLIGITDANKFDQNTNLRSVFLDYGTSELQALTLYRKFSPTNGNDYDLIVVDHKMQYNKELQNTIKEYLKKDIKYFISTTSAVSVPLSKDFERLVAEAEATANAPILISTNTASPDIETKTNHVYRFYIRSEEEAKVLCNKSEELGLKNIVYIANNNEFGRGAVKAFQNEWAKKGFTNFSGIYLDPSLSNEKIIAKITSSKLLENKPDGIFIANHGSRLQSTIKALDSIPDNIVLLSTSPLSIKTTQLPIREILAKKKWYTTIPNVRAGEEILTYNINTSFLFLTIQKLTHTIEDLAGESPHNTFHDEWTTTDEPRILEFDYDKKGDFIFDMEVDSTLVDKILE